MTMYLEMDSEEKQQFDIIKKGYKQAFTDNEFMVYGRLRESQWTGESSA